MISVPPLGNGHKEVLCSTGKRAIGGGAFIGLGAMSMSTSAPRAQVFGGAEGWVVRVANPGLVTGFYNAFAVCAFVE